MRLSSRVAVRSVTLLACSIAAGACASTRHSADPPPTAAAELEVDVCAVTQSFSARLVAHEKAPPPSVRVAHAHDWFDMGYAYATAKSQLESCIDPALEATFTTGAEVWEGMPPVTATAKFDASDTGSFTDRPADNGFDVQATLRRIELETLAVDGGVELRLSLK